MEGLYKEIQPSALHAKAKKENQKEKKMTTIEASDLNTVVGKYIVLYKDKNIVAKLEGVDEKKNEIIFTQVGGDSDKMTFRSRFDKNATDLKIYEEGEEVLALLE